MLDFMRKNTRSWGMLFLFGLIIVTFAFNFGPWAGNNMSSVPYAAIVNNHTISMAEFQTSFTSQFNMIKQYRPGFEANEAEKNSLKGMVLDQLVTRELLYQLGTSHNLRVAPEMLAKKIRERVFRPDEAFNYEEYKKRINGYFQLNISQFEAQITKELIAQEMVDIVRGSVRVSEQEIKQSYTDQNTRFAVEFVKVDPKFFNAPATVSQEEITKYIAANDKKINDYYTDHIAEFLKEEKVKASHILIKVEAGQNKEERKKKAEDILEQVKKGADFATLAKAESDDPGSKVKGGDLGFFTRTAMVEPFAEAAFKLKPGELSDVVESPFGFHIIKVTDRTSEDKKELDQAKTLIAEKLIKEEARQKEAKALAQSALESIKQGKAIEKLQLPGLINKKIAANKDKLITVEPVADETPVFSKTAPFIPKIGMAGTLGDAVSKLSLEKPVADEVVESNGMFFALKLKSREEADLSKYETEKEMVEGRLIGQRQRTFTEQFVAYLKETAKIKTNSALELAAHEE